MADVASLGIQVDSGPVRRATGDLEGFRTAAGRVASGTSQMSSAVDQMITRFTALATGAGSTVLILYKLRDAAMALADRAGNIKDFGETTGFTVMQLQALEKAGAQVGVSGEKVSRGLERFSVSMDDVKKGVGSAYESLLEINPALAKQFTSVNDLSDAWDIFAKAIKTADLEQANKLARAVFGREGVPITRLLRANADAGGLSGLIKELEKVGYITAEQADKWDTLGDNINEAMKTARQNLTAVFTEATLNVVNTFATAFLNLSVSVRNFTMGDDFKKFIEWSRSPVGMAVLAGGAGAMLGGMMGGPVGALVGAGAGGVLGAARGVDYSNRPAAQVSISGGTIDPAATAAAAAAKALEDQKRALSASIAEQERYNAVAGAAVTPAENLRLGMDKLKLAFLEGKVSADQAGKATAILNAQFNEQRVAAYVAALGEAATVSDRVRAKVDQLNAANRAGAGLSSQQIENQIRITREQAIGTYQLDTQINAERARAEALNMSAQAGLAHVIVEERINRAKQNGEVLDPKDIAALREKAEAYAKLKVQTDAYAEALNSFTSMGVSTLTTGLTDILDGTKSLSQGFSDMGKTFARAIEEMIIKMYVVQPLMNSLKGVLSGFGGGFGFANGGAFANDNIKPFANGGTFTNSIVDQPTLFKFAGGMGLMGEAGPEAILPLRRGRDGRLGVSSPSVNAGGNVSIVVNNTGTPQQVESSREVADGFGGRRIELTMADATARGMNVPGGSADIALRQRGAAPMLKRR